MTRVSPKDKKRLLIVSIPIILLVIVLLAINLSKPERSVASFCKVYKSQLNELPSSKGDGYKVEVFPGKSTGDAKVFKNAFNALESVAPKDIEPDVVTLRKVFESIDKDPANAVNASLGGLSAESSVTKYVEDNCK